MENTIDPLSQLAARLLSPFNTIYKYTIQYNTKQRYTHNNSRRYRSRPSGMKGGMDVCWLGVSRSSYIIDEPLPPPNHPHIHHAIIRFLHHSSSHSHLCCLFFFSRNMYTHSPDNNKKKKNYQFQTISNFAKLIFNVPFSNKKFAPKSMFNGDGVRVRAHRVHSLVQVNCRKTHSQRNVLRDDGKHIYIYTRNRNGIR